MVAVAPAAVAVAPAAVAVAPAAVAVAHASLVRGGKFRQERHHSVLEPPVCGVAFQHATHHPGLGAEIV